MSRKLEAYLAFTYPIELVREDDGGYFAQHPDLEGCAAQGETADEAVENLAAAREMWIRNRLADGLPVPDPPEEELSGKFLLRMPRSLHGSLARIARRENVSLNQLLNTVLASYAGGQASAATAELTLGKIEEVVKRWSVRIAMTGAAQSPSAAWIDATNLAMICEPHSRRFIARRRKTEDRMLLSYYNYSSPTGDAPEIEESRPFNLVQESALVKA